MNGTSRVSAVLTMRFVIQVHIIIRVYFSVQLITICAVVNLKCAPEKATCAVSSDGEKPVGVVAVLAKTPR